ncbi:hypothetical protein BD289DRAFT_44815 [Coniella lustricola]|uniref:Mid2 domain-containing protein n=1 Tax=Coniella lustricola TaxID=2025994 RepID=A0A2T3A1I8_9PEZI|nr:hypothetical protein BD289DRAFT_44815 [Coniella lustricola]
MMRRLHLTVLGCSLVLVQAGGFKWSGKHDGGYSPAYETALADKQYLPPVAAPEPTSPPELRRSSLGKRESSVPGSVCGYVSHNIASPLACATDNTCIFTTTDFQWMAGCCPTTSTDCAVYSTCVDSAVGASLGSAALGISTYWCSEDAFPICVTLTFEDLVGYTIYNCGESEVITLQAIDHSLAASTTQVTTTSSTTNSESSTSKSTSTCTTASSQGSSSSKSSTPIGAIVGGAVGGAAVLALIGLGIFFIYRKTKKTSPTVGPGSGMNSDTAGQGQPHYTADIAAAAAPAYVSQPTMQHQHAHGDGIQPASFGGFDDRNSVQKPPYSIQTHSIHSSTLSSPDSPPPPNSNNASQAAGGGKVTNFSHNYHSPSPPLANVGFSPTESTFHSSQQNVADISTTTIHEMASTKPDGQLRELE